MRNIFLFFSCIALLLTGCKTTYSPPRLRLNISSDPTTFDPRKGGDLVASLFHFLLFDGLVRLDDNGEVALALAERLEISEDRKVYTFYLKEVFWSDGSPITAWDFEKSWKDILRPDFPSINAPLLYPIKHAESAKKGLTSLSEVGIRSLDAHTLEITLERPTPYFLDQIAFCVFYPINVEVDKKNPKALQKANFICSGPYCVKEWRHNNQIILETNPYYYRKKEVQFQEIQFNIVNSELTSLQMFEKGQIDILGQPLVPIPVDALPALLKKNLLTIHPIPATTFCSFNVDVFPFHNVNIRKAFGYAINREQIIKNITQLDEKPALGMIPPILKKNFPSKPFFKDDDIAKARMFLEKGLKELHLTKKELPPIKYFYSISEVHHKIAQALQQQWYEALGVLVELESIEHKVLLHFLRNHAYQMAQGFWMAQISDPINIFERFKYRDNVRNYPHWQNQQYIDLLNRSNDALTERERFELLEQAEAVLLEDMPLAPIFHWNSAYIAQPYIKSYGLSIRNGFFDRVYIDQEP